jgi:hypothetical protein
MLNTPWGQADSQTKIAEGVYWVGTPSHGGLMVKQALAGVELSPKAIECAYPGAFGTWVCFEEDCSYAIAFHERPEWMRILERRSLAEAQEYVAKHPANNGYPLWDYEKNLLKAYADSIPDLEKRIAQTDSQLAAYFAKIVKDWSPEYFGEKGDA